MRLARKPLALAAGVVAVALAASFIASLDRDPIPSARSQYCGLPESWRLRIERGYFEPRSGHIALLPKQPAYMETGAGGWSHSGPWPYLQEVPLVVYGPGIVPAAGDVNRPVTLADVAPTYATLMRGAVESDGAPLHEAADIAALLEMDERPRLIVTVVWDGGGWNTLGNWPGDWDNLLRLTREGVNYTNATVGSSPSVTPAVHTTLGTGFFPWRHGITGVPVRDEEGVVVDAFLDGDSSRFIQEPAIAERWDEQNANRAKVAMIGYEPWHLGMIGKGAEKPGGDRDDAAWLDTTTNEWITNPTHYRLPPLPGLDALRPLLDELDLVDGNDDERWERVPLDDPARWEETPAFIRFHGLALQRLISQEGYGSDAITDLIYTNFKQIDRVGHYFNVDSPEVNASVRASDEVLGELVDFLDDEVGRGRYVVVVTADHGQQFDAPDVDGYGIAPKEVQADIDAEFGPITRAVWPTEVFLLTDEMRARDVEVADVARFLRGYTLGENEPGDAYTGPFGPSDRLFALAVPSQLVGTSCAVAGGERDASSPLG